jgi:flavin reductase (DIM6/NTAB) family NADH-FMN oxidoreductase RutF
MLYFEPIDLRKVKINPFRQIGDKWMLITAGTLNSFNTMTASWGGLGILWNKDVATCYVRPQRYTYEFMEQNECFTLSFFEEENKNILKYCGSHSGRHVDKMKETGLVPFQTENDNVSFEQAIFYYECRKLYIEDIKPSNFLDKDLEKKIYPSNDYHRLYIGEVIDFRIRIN